MLKPKTIHNLKGFRARHIPYEWTENEGWQKNPEHEEEVILLEYSAECQQGPAIIMEHILFVRSDWSLGKDRLDSFTLMED